MPTNPTGTTATGERAGQVRKRPLVSPDLVRRWAAQAGLMVRDGPLDDATVELYLYWRDQRRSADRDAEVPCAGPAWRAQGAPPPVSPALLQALSCTSTAAPCPTCGERGYVAYVDLARAIQRQRCHPCGQQWTTAIAPIVPDAGQTSWQIFQNGVLAATSRAFSAAFKSFGHRTSRSDRTRSGPLMR